MIQLKDKHVQSFLYNAKEASQVAKKQKITSWTRQIDAIDPLSVFQAAENIGLNRLYWADPAEDFTIIGIGSTMEIETNEDRFQTIRQQWEAVQNAAHIDNPFQVVGTGMLALGGMTFDPLRKQSALWQAFPQGRLTVPTYVLVKNGENYYFTINQLIDEKTDIDLLLQTIQTTKQSLLTGKPVEPESQHIIAKHEIEPEKWRQSVQKAVDHIQAGAAQKIVLAREVRLHLQKKADLTSMLHNLLCTQPNSYIFAFERGDDCFIGATPERLVRVEGHHLLSTCLAGTAPRGENKEADQSIANALLFDEKNREEHEYVVQMIKSSIEPYCDEIHIPKDPVVYPLPNLQHLYTPVRATLKQQSSVLDIVEKLHPTPALGGVPRTEALKFIRDEECSDRGWYGAPIGWIDSNANSEFAVAIRSGLVQGDEVSLFAGCGVMRDSTPEIEYEETNVKFLPMLNMMEVPQ